MFGDGFGVGFGDGLGMGLGGGMRFGVGLGGGAGLETLAARGFEGSHGDLQGVDHLAGAAGVDGVLGEAVDDGGKGDEDAGAVLDGRKLHAGDLGVDEDAVVLAVVSLDQVVVAVILAFHGG